MPARMHGQRGQGAIELEPVGPQAAEEDMSGDLTLFFGDQFEEDIFVSPQSRHERGLVRPPERRGQDVGDGVMIASLGVADHRRATRRRSSRLRGG